MGIHPLVSGMVMKGVASLASKALDRFDEEREPQSSRLAQGQNVSPEAKEFGRLLQSYQEMLSDRIKPPYLEGAIENNQQALEEVSAAFSQHLDALGIPIDKGRLMEQLEAGLPELEVNGEGIGSAFQGGVWQLLGSDERDLLQQAHSEASSGRQPMSGVHELALSMKKKFMV